MAVDVFAIRSPYTTPMSRYTDTVRLSLQWSFWDYQFDRWPKDKGMRFDHFLLSPKVADRLVDGGVDRWTRGQANASDHAPTRITLDL